MVGRSRGTCDADAPPPQILGRCCNGVPCYGDCVVPKSDPSAKPLCWCYGNVGGCAGGGELDCCKISARCVMTSTCKEMSGP